MRTRSSRGRQTGFTLTELMVVLVLIGILSAMIIPEMRGTYDEAVLRSTSRDLVNACGIGYSRAVSFNQQHRLIIEHGTGRFRLERRMGSVLSVERYEPVRGVPGAEGEIDARVVCQVRHAGTGAGGEDSGARRSSPDAIVFYPDGTADDAAILLRDQNGHGLRLKINPVTARVKILPGELDTAGKVSPKPARLPMTISAVMRRSGNSMEHDRALITAGQGRGWARNDPSL